MPTEEELRSGYKLGEWEILPDQGVIRRGEEENRPEPLTWRVLTSLAKRNGNLVTRDDLVEDAWYGRAVADDPINRAITQVRRALNDDARNPTYVETLQRRGYRLLQPVELLQPPESGPVPQVEVPKPNGLKRWQFAAGLFALFFAVSIYIGGRDTSPPSIGVMPFDNETPEVLEPHIVLGFKSELIVSLAALDDYNVKNIRDAGDDVPLDMELHASIRRVGDQLSVRYMIMAADGELAEAATVDGAASKPYALQVKLAEAVVERLGGKKPQEKIRALPSDTIAYDSYMRAVYELENRGERENLNDAIRLFQRSIELDKAYGPAYLGLATAYALMVDYFDAPVSEYNQLALDTIDAGVRADPGIEDAAGSIYGFIAHKEKRWQDAEEAHIRAVNAEHVDANAFNWYSRMLASVGRLDEAVVQAERGVEIDPSWGVINSRLAMAQTWVGNNAEAEEYFVRSNEHGATGVNHEMGFGVLLIRTGRVNEARERTRVGLQMIGAPQGWVDPVFDAILDESLIPDAISALDEYDTDGHIPPQASLIARGIFGDVEGAMRIARSLELPGEFFEIELLFIPEMAAVRQHPDFMPLLERLGIVDYWQQKGCIYENDKVGCN